MKIKNFVSGRRFFRVVLAVLSFVTFAGVAAIAQPPEKTGKVQQGLHSPRLVSLEDQEMYGLVTLSTGCSGSLLRNNWVLTAAHCVDDDPMKRGVFTTVPDNSVIVTAAWEPPQSQRSLRIITFRPNDVAIIRLERPFTVNGSTTNYIRDIFRDGQFPYFGQLVPLQIRAYGRGINELATGSGATAISSKQDGKFRVGFFTTNRESENRYWYRATAGQHIAGGDSGGPSFATVRGADEVIVGVHSLCNLKCVPGPLPLLPSGSQTCGDWTGPPPAPASYSPWEWVADTPECADAPVAPVWDDINRYLGPSVPPTQYFGSNDFNGDGSGDIVWHHADTHETQIWFMNRSSRIGRASIMDGARPTSIGPPWSIVGSRDFNGDGKTDLLWHHEKTGEAQIWYLDGYKFVGRATVVGENGSPAFVKSPWSIVGTNDMNGDKKTDLVWHHEDTGETQIWYLDGYRVSRRETVFNEGGTAIYFKSPWRIVGTNDFNRNGAPDILWHNADTGETQMWFMIERSVIGRATVDADRDGGGAKVGTPWSIMNH
jgi:hypothetical protein